jgi:drug/metabolite transporter (DMT)-like permease
LASSKALAATAEAPPRAVYFYIATIVLASSANWPLMKLAIADAPPLLFMMLRLAGSVACLAPALVAMRAPLLPEPGERLPLFWVGQWQVAGFMIFSIVGLSIVPAGRAIVLAYTMPLWALPIAHWLRPEPFHRGQLFGAALGFAGLLLFMNPGLIDWSDRRVLLGNLMLVLSAIVWAVGSCLYRRRVWRSPFLTQTFWQLAASTVLVAAVALPSSIGASVRWSPLLLGVLAFNALVTTGLWYFLWNKILTAMSPATAGQALALTPIGGYLVSAAIFGGEVTWDIGASLVLIVGGIVLTLRR